MATFLAALRSRGRLISRSCTHSVSACFARPARQASTAGYGVAVPSLTTSPKTADGAKQLYDEWAANYDNALESWGYPAPRRVAEVLGELGCWASERVLDLGCGTGMSGAALSAAGIGAKGMVVGTDISQASLDISSAKGLYASTVLANLDEPLQFEAGHFDAVACVGVLSYVQRFDVLFTEVARVLRSGGVFVSTHRTELWDDDYRACRSAAASLAEARTWSIERVGEPEAYMPNNPEPVEREKTIRLLAFRKL